MELRQTPGRLAAELDVIGVPPPRLVFSPGLPAGATVRSVRVEGKPVRFQTQDTGSDVHALVDLKPSAKVVIEVLYEGGVGIDVPWQPILEGDASRNLHVLKSSYAKGQLRLVVEGRPDLEYEIRLWTPWRVASATACTNITRDGEWNILRVAAPAEVRDHRDKAGYSRWTIVAGMQFE